MVAIAALFQAESSNEGKYQPVGGEDTPLKHPTEEQEPPQAFHELSETRPCHGDEVSSAEHLRAKEPVAQAPAAFPSDASTANRVEVLHTNDKLFTEPKESRSPETCDVTSSPSMNTF